MLLNNLKQIQHDYADVVEVHKLNTNRTVSTVQKKNTQLQVSTSSKNIKCFEIDSVKTIFCILQYIQPLF